MLYPIWTDGETEVKWLHHAIQRAKADYQSDFLQFIPRACQTVNFLVYEANRNVIVSVGGPEMFPVKSQSTLLISYPDLFLGFFLGAVQ